MERLAGATEVRPEMAAAASSVLARAFFDDPMSAFLFPDEARRAEILPSLYRTAIDHAIGFGGAHTTPELDAVALWVPPGTAVMTPDQELVAADSFALPLIAEERERLARLVEQLEALRQRLVPAPHWYLDILGVDPPAQGRGIGGRIIQPVLRRATEAGVACYLETFKERNLAFYQKHRFAALPAEQIPNGPRFWPMLRRPRAS